MNPSSLWRPLHTTAEHGILGAGAQHVMAMFHSFQDRRPSALAHPPREHRPLFSRHPPSEYHQQRGLASADRRLPSLGGSLRQETYDSHGVGRKRGPQGRLHSSPPATNGSAAISSESISSSRAWNWDPPSVPPFPGFRSTIPITASSPDNVPATPTIPSTFATKCWGRSPCA